MTVQVWDQCERLYGDFDGTVTLETTDPEAVHPDTLSFADASDGVVRQTGIQFASPGIHYLTLTVDRTGEQFISNPIRVDSDHDQQVYWGDIHLHSRLSDGTGSLGWGYRYGRDVMDLDVVAYTDHDTMGFFIPPSWQRSRMHGGFFDRLLERSQEFTDEDEFVSLPGYEWTKQPNQGGHINVYFEDPEDAQLFDSIASESRTYEQLWSRLREWDDGHDSGVVTIPHHPAEAMYPFDFAAVDYDDELAPLVEVYSQWGSSEQPGGENNRFPLAMGQGEIGEDGHYVQDAHQLGYRVGMVGGSDYHGPHPGHSLIHTEPHLPSIHEWRRDGVGWGNIWRVWDEQSYPGGLTAFLAPELSRSAIFDALRSRSVYATTQPHRILVDFRIDGVDVASQSEGITVDSRETPRTVEVHVAGTEPIERITVVKNTEPWRTLEGTTDADAGLDAYTAAAEWTDETSLTGTDGGDASGPEGDVYTVRVRQASDRRYPGTAWVGPLWVEAG